MLSTLLKYKHGRDLEKILVLFSCLLLSACMPEYGELDTNTEPKYDVQQCTDTQAEAKKIIDEQIVEGEIQYQQQCASCHGVENQGTKIANALRVDSDFNGFINATVERMPMADPAMCDAQCAAQIAQFLSPESAESVSQCEDNNEPEEGEGSNETPQAPDNSLLDWEGAKVTANDSTPASTLSIDTNNGVISVTASGGDIWGTNDDFFFVNQALKGNGSISAQVLFFENTSGWSKTGVMIRDGLEANAKHASLFLTGGEANGLAFQWRENMGGASSFDSGNSSGIFDAPVWLKLERSDNT